MKRSLVAVFMFMFAVSMAVAMGGGAPEKPAANSQKETALAGKIFIID